MKSLKKKKKTHLKLPKGWTPMTFLKACCLPQSVKDEVIQSHDCATSDLQANLTLAIDASFFSAPLNLISKMSSFVFTVQCIQMSKVFSRYKFRSIFQGVPTEVAPTRKAPSFDQVAKCNMSVKVLRQGSQGKRCERSIGIKH